MRYFVEFEEPRSRKDFRSFFITVEMGSGGCMVAGDLSFSSDCVVVRGGSGSPELCTYARR